MIRITFGTLKSAIRLRQCACSCAAVASPLPSSRDGGADGRIELCAFVVEEVQVGGIEPEAALRGLRGLRRERIRVAEHEDARVRRPGVNRAVDRRELRRELCDCILDASPPVELTRHARDDSGEDASRRHASELRVVPADRQGDQVHVRIAAAGCGDPVELGDLRRIFVVRSRHVGDDGAAAGPEAPGAGRAAPAGDQRRIRAEGPVTAHRGRGRARRCPGGTAGLPRRTSTSRRVRCNGAGPADRPGVAGAATASATTPARSPRTSHLPIGP